MEISYEIFASEIDTDVAKRDANGKQDFKVCFAYKITARTFGTTPVNRRELC